jgi:sirohydrochlorin cobaltochelatase
LPQYLEGDNMKQATILLAHGARNPDWARPILAIRDAMLARRPEARVEAAFLEFIAPRLPETVAALVTDGFLDLVIVPMFMAQTGHTQRDLPALLEAATTLHPGLSIRVALPIGEAAGVVAAIAEYALNG